MLQKDFWISLAEKFGWESFEVLAKHKGTELEYIVTEHPWDTEVDELVILGDHVTLDSGTGVVHTALVLVKMTTMLVLNTILKLLLLLTNVVS